MKYVPNIISIVRMLLSLLLICCLNNIFVFCVIYILCGLSDILDGYIARKTNTQSEIGAKIDSVADFMMFGVIIVVMIIFVGNQLMTFLPLIIAITIIRFMNLAIAVHKYHSFISLHTWGNKITGLLVFVTPIIFILSHNATIILLVSIIAVLSAIEEGLINITSHKLDLNKRSIFLDN